MRVFITGATGVVGSAVVGELIGTGHDVLGLARSGDAADRIKAAGAEPFQASLTDLDRLRAGAEAADAAIHLGFDPDFARFAQACEEDRNAIDAIGSVLVGTDKPFLVPNGLAGLAPPGRVVTEEDGVPPDYRFPRASEQTALALAGRGVRACVVRLPQVHSTAKQGLVTRLIQVARGRGVSAHVGEGRNRWPAAHISDVARLFRLALEAGGVGLRYHAVGEEGIEVRTLAGIIGRKLGVPTRSLSLDEAREHFGPLAMFVSADMPTSAETTRARLGWEPVGPTMMDDLEAGL